MLEQEYQPFKNQDRDYERYQTPKVALQIYIFDDCYAITRAAYERFVGAANNTQSMNREGMEVVAVSKELIDDILMKNPSIEPVYIDLRKVKTAETSNVKDELEKNVQYNNVQYNEESLLNDQDKIEEYINQEQNSFEDFNNRVR